MYLIIIIISIIILYNIFLVFFNTKIITLENIILKLFTKRWNLIPSMYDITYNYINKHDEVFKEILKLRKNQITQYSQNNFLENINNEALIHKEINFIFNVCNKNPKIQKNEKFLLIRDNFLEQSNLISEKIELYRKIIKNFNNFLKFKNLTIIWLFINLNKKENI